MKKVSTLKLNLMRATLMLALIVSCATAWAQTRETVSYIDADGNMQTHEATVLTGSETELSGGWYVVNNNVNYTATITISGETHLILADGKKMTVTVTSRNCISSTVPLTIYGQSMGSDMGVLTLSNDVSNWSSIFMNGAPLTINGGHINITGDADQYPIYVDHNDLTINGGKVTTSKEIYAVNTSNVRISINGGQITAGSIAAQTGTIQLGSRIGTDYIKSDNYGSSYYPYDVKIADGQTLYVGNTPYIGTLTSEQIAAITGKTLRPYSSDDFSVNADSTEYTIHNATGWNVFCDALQDNDTYNRFSGKTVKLGANISVSRMAGSDHHDFCGTFDGDGHTLTFNYGSTNSYANDEYTAPFRYVSNTKPVGSNTDSPAAIKNLHVAGDIYTTAKCAAGLIARQWCTVNVENCRSSIVVHSNVTNSSTGNDGTHGGFVSVQESGTLSFTGCLFDGKLLTNANNLTTKCGGFVGWRSSSGTLKISNSLYAPNVVEGEPWVGDSESATFSRNWTGTPTNCYYTRTLGTEQGKQAHSITAVNYVTVAHSGTATVYTTSGITAYKNGDTQLPGLLYNNNNNNVLYAGNGDAVSLTLTNTPPQGSLFMGYTVSPEGTTLNGNNPPYTLNMPNADVTIDAMFTVTYLDENGMEQQCIDYTVITADEYYNLSLSSLNAGQWYVINEDLYSHVYNINVNGEGAANIILVDGVSCSIHAFMGDYALVLGSVNIYGQSLGTGTLNLTGGDGYFQSDAGYYAQPAISGNIAVYGGIVNASRGSGESGGNYAINGNVICRHGKLTVSVEYGCGISGHVDISGGELSTVGSIDGYINFGGGKFTSTDGQIGGNVTLDWTSTDDRFYAGFIFTYGTVTVAAGKAFTDGNGNVFSGTVAPKSINGKTLYPVTAYKTIAAHSTTEQPVSGWYLIASPVGDVSATAVNNLANTDDNDGFDLYRFNQSAELEWENWKSQECEGNHYHFDLESGRGYLYANAEDVNLIFTGTPYSGPCEITLTKATDAGIDFSGWNLVGNPFNETAYIDKTDFYRMNEEGSEIEVATDNAIAPMEGIFVLADENGETLTFSTQEPNKGHSEKPKPEQIVLNLSSNGGSVIDRAIVRMGEGGTLPKFQIRENSTKIYIPQGGKDYAIVSVGNVSEIPVNFKAEENGTYTLTVSPTLNSQLSTLNYLHLIDNMTGADIDLIPSLRAVTARHEAGSNPEPPVSYTFTAKTTDYESRFKLVFIANDASTGSASDATFAFVSNGSIIVNGEGTLQVIDLMGRVIRTVGLSHRGSRCNCIASSGCPDRTALHPH